MVNSASQSFTMEADGIEVMLDLDVGHLSSFTVTRCGRKISPFHKAPWGAEPLHWSIPPHLRKLSIDFFVRLLGHPIWRTRRHTVGQQTVRGP